MPKLLEVIVTSLDEAVEAEIGGADRLELVRSLDEGGFTPSPDDVRRVVEAVAIPVRVMLRENATMSAGGRAEIETLIGHARTFSRLAVDGLVLGFVRNGSLDSECMREILAAAPNCRATFHLAFEHTNDPLRAIEELKRFPQIDRILTRGGEGPWKERKARLLEWQRAAAPEIRVLVGIGLRTSNFAELKQEPSLQEVHAGRAVRVPPSTSGRVDRTRIAALKSALL
ncbi:MAG: copper homeostasis protein CutC [Bryobacteraceae bacterium]